MDFLIDPVTFLDQWARGWLLIVGVPADIVPIIMIIIGAGILAAGPLFFTIFLIWVERKLISRFQDRLGPNRVGPFGLFQTFADMVKIFTKELITPSGAEIIPYNIAPVLTVASVIMLWAVVPFMPNVIGSNIHVGALYIIAVGALGTLGIILAGWSSNNKYALLGAFRAVAQLISYEVPMVIVLLIPVMLSGSMGMNDLVNAQKVWFIFLSPLGGLILFISLIAEVGRSPFDLLEADSELVSGFNIEYSGLKFGFFYVADFLHAFTIALLFATIYLGGWQGPFVDRIPVLGFFYLGIKTAVAYFLAYSFRASLPRFRIDQMMDFNWKLLTPLSLGVLLLTAVVDKIIPREFVLLQMIAAWVFNFILIVIADQMLRSREKRHAPRVVAPETRPVARPENCG